MLRCHFETLASRAEFVHQNLGLVVLVQSKKLAALGRCGSVCRRAMPGHDSKFPLVALKGSQTKLKADYVVGRWDSAGFGRRKQVFAGVAGRVPSFVEGLGGSEGEE
jgi:hypothetical protein